MPLRFWQLNLALGHKYCIIPPQMFTKSKKYYKFKFSPLFSANRAVPAEHSQSTRRAQRGVWLPVGVCADLTHWGVLPAQHLPSNACLSVQLLKPNFVYSTMYSMYCITQRGVKIFEHKSKRSLWKRIYCLNYFIKEHRYMRNTWKYKSCDTATLNIQR